MADVVYNNFHVYLWSELKFICKKTHREKYWLYMVSKCMHTLTFPYVIQIFYKTASLHPKFSLQSMVGEQDCFSETYTTLFCNYLRRAQSFLKSWQLLRKSRNYRPFLEPKGSLLYSHEPTTGARRIQCTTYISKIYFSVIIHQRQFFQQGLLPPGFPTSILYAF
jgi:hypothetical protein